MAKRKIRDERLGGAKTYEALFGPDGVLKAADGRAWWSERCELSEHLDGEKEARLPNRRNGSSEKTLHPEHGPMPIEVPRDRESRFEPQLVPQHLP